MVPSLQVLEQHLLRRRGCPDVHEDGRRLQERSEEPSGTCRGIDHCCSCPFSPLTFSPSIDEDLTYPLGCTGAQVLHIAYDDVPVPEKYRGANGGLNFATADPITLPAKIPSSKSWLDRARVAVSSIGSAAPHMLSSKIAFFLSIACSASLQSQISDAAKRTPENWTAANRVDDKYQLHNFQVTPVADWKPEDLILGLSFLGECMQPNTQRLLELGIDGWLLEVVDDRVLEV